MKIEILTFNEDLDIEEFLDWIDEYDRVKEYSSFLR
jgi:hypothetical protein